MSKITDADIDARKSYLARLESEGMFETNVRTDWLRSILTELRALRSKGEAVAWRLRLKGGARGSLFTDHEQALAVSDGFTGSYLEPLYTHPAPQEAVGVKALEWERGTHWAQARCKAVGLVQVTNANDGWDWRIGNEVCEARCDTMHEAIEEAEEERLARILSALTHPAPATGVSDARILEVLKPFADAVHIIRDDEDEDYAPAWSPFITVRAYRSAAALVAALTEEGGP